MSKQDEVAQDILTSILEGLLEARGDWTAQAADGTDYEVEFSESYPEIVATHQVSGRELARYRLSIATIPAGPSPNLDVVSLVAVTNPRNRNGQLVAVYTRGDHKVDKRDIKDLFALYNQHGLECDDLPAALSWVDTCDPEEVVTPLTNTNLRCTIVGYLG